MQAPTRTGRALRATVTALLIVSSAAGWVALQQATATAETIILPGTGSIQVTGNGNGHGHGLSQYGARGAAQSGLSAAQIVAFYYPGTTLATISGSTTLRVLITKGTPYTCVQAKAGLSVAGAALSATGVTRFRLVPSGNLLAVQKTSGSACTSGTWTTVKDGLPSSADFSSTQGYLRLYLNDGTSTDYRGALGAVRSGTGEITVNRVGIDAYTQGVVPREMPASWAAAAVQAQAIAARTYAEYEREHASGTYDICDTTQCQVYGGANHYDAGGNLLWSEDPAAISGNSGQIVRYGGAAAFTQFSASDGGWTVSGGQPYLPAKADPYDTAAAGDPYIHWTASVPVSQVASAYGFARVTQIQITQRDGHGEWGGRVLAATVYGIKTDGSAGSVPTTGFGLQDAMNLMHNWFVVRTPATSSLGATIVHSTSTSASVFYQSTATKHLTGRTWTSGSGWAAPVDLGAPPAGVSWDPDAATSGSGHIDVAIRDGSGHLAMRSYNGTVWSQWFVYAPTMLSSPAVTSPRVGETDVFYLGANHTIWTLNWIQGVGWSAAFAVPGVTNAASGPDATTLLQTTKAIVVAYRGTDGQYWTVTRAGSAWGAPTRANPTRALPKPTLPNADPSINNSGTGSPNVYYTGNDGVVYHAGLNTSTGAWSPWYSVPGGSTTGAPDTWTDDAAHADLVSGHNGVIGTMAWSTAAGWRAWTPIT
ncbi:MAG: stage sporulation protein [Pseudonocardiales bacterium]|nr:stage sporulation protein [Pseudonocardiales bacterium]